MIFLGDIACPKEKIIRFKECVNSMSIFKNEIVVANLEANILSCEDQVKDLTLYNDAGIVGAFSNAKQFIVSLANNHMYDYPEYIKRTADKLKLAGIGAFGVNIDNHTSSTNTPHTIEVDGHNFAFFGHCWRLYTSTNRNTLNDYKVVDCFYDDFINQVAEYTISNPDTKVYCFMHWNYDLERLPMPMHRNIARKLIDVGASGVIGSHSHVPQGGEIYKGKPIVYGLGNFYLPSGIFFNGNLSYPEASKMTYALQINDDKLNILWFRTDSQGEIVSFDGMESFDGDRLKRISPFANMSDKEYISYFRKNRTKKLLVPVFVEYTGLKHSLQESYAITRVKVLRRLFKLLGR